MAPSRHSRASGDRRPVRSGLPRRLADSGWIHWSRCFLRHLRLCDHPSIATGTQQGQVQFRNLLCPTCAAPVTCPGGDGGHGFRDQLVDRVTIRCSADNRLHRHRSHAPCSERRHRPVCWWLLRLRRRSQPTAEHMVVISRRAVLSRIPVSGHLCRGQVPTAGRTSRDRCATYHCELCSLCCTDRWLEPRKPDQPTRGVGVLPIAGSGLGIRSGRLAGNRRGTASVDAHHHAIQRARSRRIGVACSLFLVDHSRECLPGRACTAARAGNECAHCGRLDAQSNEPSALDPTSGCGRRLELLDLSVALAGDRLRPHPVARTRDSGRGSADQLPTRAAVLSLPRESNTAPETDASAHSRRRRDHQRRCGRAGAPALDVRTSIDPRYRRSRSSTSSAHCQRGCRLFPARTLRPGIPRRLLVSHR